MAVTVRAFAKINLTLEVLGRRADGYHELRSIYQTLAFHDRLRVEARPRGCEIESTHAELERGPANLIHQAWRLLRLRGAKGAKVWVEKRIPLAAGLGGGSSDAAAMLLALDRLYRLELGLPLLLELGARLGADVPLFLIGGTVLGVGRGSEVYPLPDLKPAPVVLVFPGFGVRTPWAFGALPNSLTGRPRTHKILSFAAQEASVYPELVNDLEPVVGKRYPVVPRIRGRLLELGARQARMTGSGPTLYGLYAGRAKAVAAARALRRSGLQALATVTLARRELRRRRFGSS
ncbi:MAG TPA: 4-(cytidine 5'-diphospho)-2-C-methyl-D-erythritol kinase [Acidobacteriota bacterium]